MTTETSVSIREAMEVSQALTDEKALEAFVADLPAAKVPEWLAALLEAEMNLRALHKGLEMRLSADGQVGNRWEIGGKPYGFFGAQAKGFKSIPDLFTNLAALGVSPIELYESVSDARVTDLRKSAGFLSNAEQRADALEAIEEARVPKGERGAPRFQAMEYVKGAK